ADLDMAKPVALITGGARGIGRAIARHLLVSGWQAGIIDLPDSGLRRVFSRERGVLLIDGDVRDEGTASDAVEALVHRFGRLDAVLSNAGMMIRKPGRQTGGRRRTRGLASRREAIRLCYRRQFYRRWRHDAQNALRAVNAC